MNLLLLSKSLFSRILITLIGLSLSVLSLAQPCQNFTIITCGNNNSFIPDTGPGSSLFPNGLGSSCFSTSGNGGSEQFYKFKATATGIYNFEITSAANDVHVEYYYKNANLNACDFFGWNCLGYDNSPSLINGINLAENDSIWILANSESSTIQANQEWKVTCATTLFCENYSTINCDIPVVFAPASEFGDPLFSNNIVPGCSGNFGQGGPEAIYQFTAEITGVYNTSVSNITGPGKVAYYYKPLPSDPCSPTGWICLGNTNNITTATANLDGIELNAGQQIWILANAASETLETHQSFQIDCGTPPACTNYQTIGCGIDIPFTTQGKYGDPDFHTGINCYTNLGQGGQESIYRFYPPITGSYNFDITSSNGGGLVQYFYKSSNQDPCSTSGWNCIGRESSVVHLNSLNLEEDAFIWILANAEFNASFINQTFQISCGEPLACENIIPIECDQELNFSASGYGSTYYNFPGCGGIPAVGKEKIYSLTSPVTGLYEIETTSASTSGSVKYSYKLTSMGLCTGTGFQCIGASDSPEYVGNFVVQSGQTIYLLVDSESEEENGQTFKLRCARPITCNDIEVIQCGEPTLFNVEAGPGESVYPNNLNADCNSTTSLAIGGKERIYHFTAPVSGNYQIRTLTLAEGGAIQYRYSTDDPCSNYGWNCLGVTSAVTSVEIVSLQQGQSIYLLLNAQYEEGANQYFQIDCAMPLHCEEIIDVHCDVPYTFYIDQGFGSPEFQNSFLDDCGESSAHGGREQVFRFVPETTGFYEIQVLEVSNNRYCEYVLSPFTASCNNNNGYTECIGTTNIPTSFDNINMLGQFSYFFMVNSEASNQPVSQKFVIRCSESNDFLFDSDYSPIICANTTDGYIDISMSDDSSPLYFNWLDVEGSIDEMDRVNLAPGTYAVEITDILGNEFIYEFNIQAFEQTVVTSIITNPSSESSNDGAIDLSILGSSTPYIVDWLDVPGATNDQDRENIGIGSYCIEIIDDNQCTSNTCINVDLAPSETEPLSLNYELIYPGCSSSLDASIDLEVTGGIAPYTYDWSDMEGINNIADRYEIEQGEYSITVTDAEGSIVTENISAIPNPEITIEINKILPNPSENLFGAIEILVSGGSGQYTILWDNTIELEGDHFSFSNLQQDNYCFTITDSNNCIEIACESLLNDFTPNENIQGNIIPASCEEVSNGSIDIDFNLGTPPYSYNWFDLLGEDNEEDRTNLFPGTYALVITDFLGETFNELFTVPQASTLSIIDYNVTDAASNSNNNGTIEIFVIGGVTPYTYNWLDIPGSDDPANRTNLYPDTYCVQVTDSIGCTDDRCISVSTIVSIDEIVANDVINTSPNPFKNDLELSVRNGVTIWEVKVYSTQGKLIWMNESNNQRIIPLSHLSSGLYILEVDTNIGTYRKKITKN